MKQGGFVAYTLEYLSKLCSTWAWKSCWSLEKAVRQPGRTVHVD